MKRRKLTQVQKWFILSREKLLADKAWLASDEGQEFLKSWKTGRDARIAKVRRMIAETVSVSSVLKEIYPDHVAPAEQTFRSDGDLYGLARFIAQQSRDRKA